jgi:ABC-type antimicrobial peptide transport system permease subunit
MNPRLIINSLVAIILAFTIKGFCVLQDVNKTVEYDLVQQQSVTQDIGMAFDWYGLTVVDSIVKYTHDMLSAEELIETLKDGKVDKDQLLRNYYRNATAVENEYVNKLKSYDTKVDLFIDRVIAQAADKGYQTDEAMIKEMYSLTQPAVDIINTIIDLKTEQSTKIKQTIHSSIESLEYFLMLVTSLAIVIGISGNRKKSSKSVE